MDLFFRFSVLLVAGCAARALQPLPFNSAKNDAYMDSEIGGNGLLLVLQHPQAICEIAPPNTCVNRITKWPSWTIYHLRRILLNASSTTTLPKNDECIGISRADTICLGNKWPQIFQSPPAPSRLKILNTDWCLYYDDSPQAQNVPKVYFMLAGKLYSSTQVAERLKKIPRIGGKIKVKAIKDAFKYNVLTECQLLKRNCYLTRMGFCYSCDQPGEACDCSDDWLLPWSQTDMPLQNRNIPCDMCSQGVYYSPGPSDG